MPKLSSKKLSIAFLDFDDIKNPLLGAGQATATYELGGELARRGHTVTVYCSKYSGYKDRKENGIRYKHVGFYTNNIKINNFLYILTAPLVALTLKKTDIILECFTAPVSTLLSPLFTNIPVIAVPSMFNAAEFSRKYKLPFYLIEQFGMRFYKYMLPYSDSDTAKAKKLNPSIITKIVPQGVNKRYFSIKPQKHQHILFLSRFDVDQKGIDLLLQAYALVKNKIKYPLVIAGHGPDEAKIRKMISELKLDKKVSIVGSAYGKKKEELMAQAAFVAFPSRHDEMCLWTLEALAGSLPIIAFDIPESSWLNNDVSLKAKPFNVKSYGKLLLKVTNPKLLTKMRQSSKRFAKTFTWEKVADEYESFIREVLAKESK